MPNPNSKLMDVASQAFSAAKEPPAKACHMFLSCFAHTTLDQPHNFGPLQNPFVEQLFLQLFFLPRRWLSGAWAVTKMELCFVAQLGPTRLRWCICDTCLNKGREREFSPHQPSFLTLHPTPSPLEFWEMRLRLGEFLIHGLIHRHPPRRLELFRPPCSSVDFSLKFFVT